MFVRRTLSLFMVSLAFAMGFPFNVDVAKFSNQSTVLAYPEVSTSYPEPTMNWDVPFFRQQYALSCELATLRMALAQRGIYPTEDEIIARTPFAPMWSDPNYAFVGTIRGRQMRDGYGIHWDALAGVANSYTPAQSFHQQDLRFLISKLQSGSAVIIWGSLDQRPRARYVRGNNGFKVPLVSGEHTWVVTGYAGAEDNPTHIFTIDPLYGHKVFPIESFMRNWSHLGNSGVVLQ